MEFKATIKGISPLKMNRPVLDVKMPRIRTQDDLVEDAKRRTYFDEKIGFYVPVQAMRLSIVNGGKKIKQGRAFLSTFLGAVLRIKENEKISLNKKSWDDVIFVKELHNIQGQKIEKCFVVLENWELTFNGFSFEKIDSSLLKEAIKIAGIYEGLLEGRPGTTKTKRFGGDFGRFELKDFEVTI